MTKTKTPTGKGPNEIDVAHGLIAQAERLKPKLLKRREDLRRELAQVDDALAKLDRLGGARPVTVHAPAAPSKAKAQAPAAVLNGETARAPSVASVVIQALSSASTPLNAAELARAVEATRPTNKAILQNTLRDLRAKGLVKATGKAKRFSYSLTGTALSTGPAPASVQTRAPKPKRVAAKAGHPSKKGGRTVREIVLETLSDKPIAWSAILAAVTKERPDVAPGSVSVIVQKMRKDGQVKTSGAPKDYRYTAA